MRYSARDLDIVWENQDEESLLIDLKKGVYYSFLDGTAFILECLLSGHTTEETKDQLKSLLDGVSESELSSRVQSVTQLLLDDDLVKETPDRTVDKHLISSDVKISKFPEVEKFDDMTEIFEMDPIHDGDLERGWPVQAS